MLLLLLYHIVTVHTLGPAPLYAWLLLVSAWARRAPFLWAVLPPLAIGGLEKLVFNTTYFANVIANRLTGGGTEAGAPPGALPPPPNAPPSPRFFPHHPSPLLP